VGSPNVNQFKLNTRYQLVRFILFLPDRKGLIKIISTRYFLLMKEIKKYLVDMILIFPVGLKENIVQIFRTIHINEHNFRHCRQKIQMWRKEQATHRLQLQYKRMDESNYVKYTGRPKSI
jgi:hypothetical protein